jgi:hypothetical protein
MSADYECPVGPCDYLVLGYGCQFQYSCGQVLRRIEESGYTLVRTGEVPSWMEQVTGVYLRYGRSILALSDDVPDRGVEVLYRHKGREGDRG